MKKISLDTRYLRTKLSSALLRELIRISAEDTVTNLTDIEVGRVGVNRDYACRSRTSKKMFQFLKHNKFSYIKTLSLKPAITTYKCRDGYGRLHTVELNNSNYFNSSLMMLDAVERFKIHVTTHEFELMRDFKKTQEEPTVK